MFTALKRLVVGDPIATERQDEQRLPKSVGLATFSSDAISSTAYATEEILFVVAVGGSSLALGRAQLVPISIVVAVLIAIVVASYRQTIFAYPHGGGAYLVSRDNLGRYPSLVAGASLLVDYILTVAVSVSAGVAAIISLPAFRGLANHRVGFGLLLIVVITAANLRGLKESGKLFAYPTYTYIVSLSLLIAYGLIREALGDLDPIPPPSPAEFEGALAGGSLSLLVLLRGFSSGAVALTGIEALADGVPSFRRPAARNAATTLVLMGVILGTLFFGVSVLAHHLGPYPSETETVISQMGRAVYGGGPIYVILQLATAAILTLAANTAFADFPRLSSIIARDGYLPHQFKTRGDRLVFSNGILFLAVAAGLLLVAFGGVTNALIPLYAVGVFTSFTISQTAMVVRLRRRREAGWQRRMAVSAVGALATFSVLIVVAVSKFTAGAWLPIVVVPSIIVGFLAIRRHYDRVGHALAIAPEEVRQVAPNHTVVVLVGSVHRGTLAALAYARSLRPQHLVAVYVAVEDDERDRIQRQWRDFGIEVPLEIIQSPYRDLVTPITSYLDELDANWENDTITVVIPEFVVTRWYEQVLHNQSAFLIKARLLFRPNTVVTSVPYHLERGRLEVAGPEVAGPESPGPGRDGPDRRQGVPPGPGAT